MEEQIESGRGSSTEPGKMMVRGYSLAGMLRLWAAVQRGHGGGSDKRGTARSGRKKAKKSE